MNILILGATGMLGHKLMQVLADKFAITGTMREDASDLSDHPVFSGIKIIGNIRADDLGSIQNAIDLTETDVVINCVGIVKQLPAANNPLQSIDINALFPHQLASFSRKNNIRMSTDCPFSGKKYRKEDAQDPCGKTKYLDEVDYPGSLPLRTSIIVREPSPSRRFIESFTSQKGKTVSGYTKTVFSGLLTRVRSENTSISWYPDRYSVRPIIKNTTIS